MRMRFKAEVKDVVIFSIFAIFTIMIHFSNSGAVYIATKNPNVGFRHHFSKMRKNSIEHESRQNMPIPRYFNAKNIKNSRIATENRSKCTA